MEPKENMDSQEMESKGGEQKGYSQDYQKVASWATTVKALAGLYALIVVCATAVMMLTSFMRIGNQVGQLSDATYTLIFLIATQGLGGLFSVMSYGYLHITKRRMEQQNEQKRRKELEERKEYSNVTFVGETASISESAMPSSQSRMSLGEVKEQFEQKPSLSFEAEGASSFARMGLIGFGIGATLLDGMRMMQYIDNPQVLKCYGKLYFASAAVNIYFIWCEMFFIIKFHNVIINVKRGVMKIALSHLLAVNLSQWISTIILEGAMGKMKHFKNSTGGSVKPSCGFHDTIYTRASPYLYPFVIEFSLLAATLVYRISTSIGTLVIHKGKPISEEDEGRDVSKFDCHRSHTGLFYGFIIFIGALCATSLYIYHEASEGEGNEHSYDDHNLFDDEIKEGKIPNSNLIYLITSILLTSISFIVLIPTIVKLHKMRYVQPESLLDQYVLTIAIIGYYMLFGLVAIPAVIKMENAKGSYLTLAQLVVSVCFLEIGQVTFQVVVIVHGLRRRAKNAEQEDLKPGRSLLTFLIVVNMAMWLANTFLLKGLHDLPILTKFYGAGTWDTLMHVFLPLSIFYRFHAAVCFAEIWSNAYTREEHCTISYLRFAQVDNEEMQF